MKNIFLKKNIIKSFLLLILLCPIYSRAQQQVFSSDDVVANVYSIVCKIKNGFFFVTGYSQQIDSQCVKPITADTQTIIENNDQYIVKPIVVSPSTKTTSSGTSAPVVSQKTIERIIKQINTPVTQIIGVTQQQLDDAINTLRAQVYALPRGGGGGGSGLAGVSSVISTLQNQVNTINTTLTQSIADTAANLQSQIDNLPTSPSSTASFSTSTTRGVFSSSAPALTYATSTGIFSLTSGYNIPTSASSTAWDALYADPTSRISLGTGLLRTGNSLSVSTSSLGLTTTNVAEGTNLYFTNALADARVNSVVGATTTLANITTLSNLSTVGTITSGTWHGSLISDAYLTKTGDWTGTFDGQEGAYYLANSFSTTSANGWFGTKTTDGLTEGSSNKYFSNALADARANIQIAAASSTVRGMVSSTATGLTYSSGTGVFSLTSGYNIPTSASSTAWDALYADPTSRISLGTGLLRTGNSLSVSTSSLGLTTTNVAEGTNLYFTNALADARANIQIAAASSTVRGMLSSTATGLSYAISTGIFSLTSGYSIPTSASLNAFVNNATDATLTRSGAGPYTLGLNLTSDNTWTGRQDFDTVGINNIYAEGVSGGGGGTVALHGNLVTSGDVWDIYGFNLVNIPNASISQATIDTLQATNLTSANGYFSTSLMVGAANGIQMGDAPTGGLIVLNSSDGSGSLANNAINWDTFGVMRVRGGIAVSNGVQIGDNPGNYDSGVKTTLNSLDGSASFAEGLVGIGTLGYFQVTRPGSGVVQVDVGNNSGISSDGILNVSNHNGGAYITLSGVDGSASFGSGATTIDSVGSIRTAATAHIGPDLVGGYITALGESSWPFSVYMSGGSGGATTIVDVGGGGGSGGGEPSYGLININDLSGNNKVQLLGVDGSAVFTGGGIGFGVLSGSSLGNYPITIGYDPGSPANSGIRVGNNILYYDGRAFLAGGNFSVDTAGNITRLNNVTTSFPSSQGAANTFLKNDGTGILTWVSASTSGLVSGTGTNGKLARWTSNTGLSTGIILDNGTVSGINATSSTSTFFVQGTGSLNPFVVASSTGTQLFTILSTGNVGIGTTTPGTLLSVVGTSTLQNIIPAGAYTGNVSAYNLGASTTRWKSLWAQTVNIGTSTWSLAQTGTRFGIFNAPESGGTEALSILSSGNIGIGTTTPSSKLVVAGSTLFTGTVNMTGLSTDSTTIGIPGVLCINNTNEVVKLLGVSTCIVSSRDFKDNILNLNHGLDWIKAMRPVTFDFKTNGSPSLGFIAEEMDQISPLLTARDGNGKVFTVRYELITSVLTKAVQELNTKFDSVVTSVVDGVAYLKNVVAEKFTVGSSAKPAGITIYDEDTGQPYCMKMKGGAMVSVAGECVSATTSAQSSNTNSNGSSASSGTDNSSTSTSISTSTPPTDTTQATSTQTTEPTLTEPVSSPTPPAPSTESTPPTDTTPTP